MYHIILQKTVSEQFKETVTIKNLPPLVKKRLKKSDLLYDGADDDTIGLCNLFAPC